MGLSFPHSLAGNHRKIAQDNLEKVLDSCNGVKPTVNQLLTDVAEKALQELKDARLGIMHDVKKYLASVGAYGATVAVPVTAVLGTTYYLCQDYIKNPELIPPAVFRILTNSFPSFTKDFSDDPVGYYTNVAKGAVLGVIAADVVLQKSSGRSLLKPIGKWSVGMLSTAWLYASYKSGELISNRYTKVEQHAKMVTKIAKECIFDQLMAAYNGDQSHFGIADELHQSMLDSQDSPKLMHELKQKAAIIEAGLPRLSTTLMKSTLTASQVAQILDKLNAVVKSIRNFGFELRSGRTEADNRYNVELMNVLADNQFEMLGLTEKSKEHIAKVKLNTLGIGHTIKSAADAVLKGGIVALASGAALPVIAGLSSTFIPSGKFEYLDYCYQQNGDCLLSKGLVGTGVALGSYTGVQKGMEVYDQHMVERDASAETAAKHTRLAEEELTKTYDSIADYLKQTFDGNVNQTGDLSNLKKLVTSIDSKLPVIENAISGSGVLINEDKVLEKLRAVTKQILSSSTPVASRVARAV